MQSVGSSDIQRLLANKTTDRQNPATVEVEESGVYFITVLMLVEELGIVGSSVGYTEQLFVSTMEITISTTDSVNKTVPFTVTGISCGTTSL